MSARQNKKQRKGRGNVHQRERTVTTLTEDPNTHYLVPTPSEEPAGAPHMPLSYNNPKMHNVQMAPSFQMGANFPYGTYAPFNPMHQQQQQQQQQPFYGPSQQQEPLPQHQQPQSQPQAQSQQQSQPQPMKPTLPPGKNDLDILQNLKKIIKDGQHPFFRAVPQPAALASIYMGTISSQSQAQGRRGETPGDSAEGQSAVGTIGVSGPAPANDTGRRQPPRMPRRPSFASTSPGGALQVNNNSSQATQANRYGNVTGANNLVTNLNLASLKISRNNSGPASAAFQPEPRTSDLTTPTSATEANVSDLQRRYDYSARSRDAPVMGERTGHGDSLYDRKAGSPDFPNGKGSMYDDGKDDLSRPGAWGPSDSDRTITPRPSTMGASVHADARPIGAGADRGSGPTSGRDDRFPPPGGDTRDRDNRERDRARRGDWQPSDRDRRPSLPPSSLASSHDRLQTRPADARGRPLTPAEHRQYDAEYGAASTRYVESKGLSDDVSGMQVDDRRLSAAADDDRRGRPLHAPDYTPPNRAPGDSQPNPVDSRPQPDSRGAPGSSRGPSVDSRSERVGSGIGPPSRASASDRIVPPQLQTQPSAATSAVADVDDIQSSRASSLRPTDTANQNLSSVPSPSEEGIVRGGISDMPLEDNGLRPSLKDRLIPPRSAGRASSEHPSHYGDHPGPHSRRTKFYKDRGGGGGGASFDGPPRAGDRGPSGFGTPPGNGVPMPGSGSQAPRSFHTHSPPPDSRSAKPLSSPSSVTHRHPIRGPPLGRPIGREDRGSYRAEYDPRRPDVLDDGLARYGDRSYRDFSPPLGEIPRGGGDRGGRPAPFPPSPGRVPPGGDISGRRGEWQYQQYPPPPGVPQSWDIEEGWDRSGDRDRFERDVPPRSAGWDYRGERDFIARDGYSSGPPLDDRGYAPGPHNRDTDRGRPSGPYTPPYGRVRPRSPSPMRRTGPGSMDDSRPAMKRPREDFPPSGYYSPHPPPAGNRDGPGPGPMRRPPGEYPPPPRSGSSGPPPSSASWPPPPASGGSGAGGPPGDRDRDYRMGRDGMDFPPPAGYDRPRSPGSLGRHSYGRGGGGGGYGRGDPRDRGGYGMPPRP